MATGILIITFTLEGLKQQADEFDLDWTQKVKFLSFSFEDCFDKQFWAVGEQNFFSPNLLLERNTEKNFSH